MPHFFFHTRDGERLRDEEGSDCENLTDARRSAVALASSMVNDNPELVLEHASFSVEVTDVTGQTVFLVEINAIEGGRSRQ
jgi:DNA repair ATPase RecN